MSMKSLAFRTLRPFFQRHPHLKRMAIEARGGADLVRHSAGLVVPALIRARPDSIYVTLTADCNQRCVGCRYGRDFMPGSVLSLPVVQDLLDDCPDLGIFDVRLYGGEPLLHRDLPPIVAHSVGLGLRTWITTNGLLLRQKIDRLYEAGLRHISLELYGTGTDYDLYVQRRGAFARVAFVNEIWPPYDAEIWPPLLVDGRSSS
jgi:cyclic pyranopterin phosphate synthase